MKQRIKVALSDIKYIKTQIEKILNSSKERNEVREDLEEQNPIVVKEKYKSPRKNKHQPYNTSPRPSLTKIQSKSSKKLIKKPSLLLESSPGIEEKKQQSPTAAIMMPLTKESTKKKTNEGKPNRESQLSQTQNIFNQWKMLEKAMTPKNKTQVPPQPLNEPLPIVQSKQQFCSVTSRSEKSTVPHHLSHKNRLPLRSDETFLKRKYHYDESNLNQVDLKEKYKLLDQRLNRLKTQFKKKDLFIVTEIQEQLRRTSVSKKMALTQYGRYSPLNKFMKINEKLRREYEGSLSNQSQSRSRKKSPAKRADYPEREK